MAKDLPPPWFKHDYGSRHDERMLQLRAEFGAEGYAAFFMLLECMAESSNGHLNRESIGGLSFDLSIAKETVSKIIDLCLKIGLFCEDEQGISARRMLEHITARKTAREVAIASGKKGAKVRWKQGHRVPHKSPHRGGDRGSIAEESREEESNTSTTDLSITTQDLERVGADAPTPASYIVRFFGRDPAAWQQEGAIFYGRQVPMEVIREQFEKFCSYWTELTPGGKKQRWQLQKTFEIRRRLATWFDRIEQRRQQQGKTIRAI